MVEDTEFTLKVVVRLPYSMVKQQFNQVVCMDLMIVDLLLFQLHKEHHLKGQVTVELQRLVLHL